MQRPLTPRQTADFRQIVTDIPENPFTHEIQDLDRRIDQLGRDIWVGAEPTFTDRYSEAPEWLNTALGGDKQLRAEQLVRRYQRHFPGAALLRTLGRQYPHEDLPRWNLGIYFRRDGQPAWSGPFDPLLAPDPPPLSDPAKLIRAWSDALIRSATGRGWGIRSRQPSDELAHRLLIRLDENAPDPAQVEQALLDRPSVHSGPIPDNGLQDPLADQGLFLVELFVHKTPGGIQPYAELPMVPDSGDFLALLEALAKASNQVRVPTLILRGYPPPVDLQVGWSSLTPDPAVIEANLAPASSLQEFFDFNQPLFEAARAESLSPLRLHYNGREQDSGGGGQITLGGSTPETSPFFVQPLLLPRLIRYFSHHPGLSYWFATNYVGSGSQAPRPDEGLRERFLELNLALEQLERGARSDPEFIWSSLAPFLADATGNSHRSELNIEKLWNPYLGARGRLGLVEFRPFRMTPSVETLTALAALMRALIARLMQQPFDPPLADWGDGLHERFALPCFLRQDVAEVLSDLESHGLGLGRPLTDRLLDDSAWVLGSLDWNGARIRLRRAHEFWPLIGDITTQQPTDSRLVDASTARVEISLDGLPAGSGRQWELRVNGLSTPMYWVEGGDDSTLVMGIRYRSFVPWQGLHPALPAQEGVVITLIHRPANRALRLKLHEWRPDGGPYPCLPPNQADAAARRRERVLVTELKLDDLPPAMDPAATALGEYCLDLRRIRQRDT